MEATLPSNSARPEWRPLCHLIRPPIDQVLTIIYTENAMSDFIVRLKTQLGGRGALLRILAVSTIAITTSALGANTYKPTVHPNTLNPQPLPPAPVTQKLNALNPQPLPPAPATHRLNTLNPQPLPPVSVGRGSKGGGAGAGGGD